MGKLVDVLLFCRDIKGDKLILDRWSCWDLP